MGLRQRTIAALVGRREEWVSRHIREPDPPMALRLAIVGWALMSERQRRELAMRLGLRLWRQRMVGPHETEVWGDNLASPASSSP